MKAICICGHPASKHEGRCHEVCHNISTHEADPCRCVKFEPRIEHEGTKRVVVGKRPYVAPDEKPSRRHKDGTACDRGETCTRAHLLPLDVVPGAQIRQYDEFPVVVQCRDCLEPTTVNFVRCSSCSDKAKHPHGGIPRDAEFVDPEIALIAHNLHALPLMAPDAQKRVVDYVSRFVADEHEKHSKR